MGATTEQRKIRIAIIGAGISGIGQAIRLSERLGDRALITVYERDSEAGGVWFTSQWPGAGVDVPIHWYQLYSDPKPDWPTVYAKRADVYDYWQGLIDKHGLRHSIKLNTTFLGSRWSELTHRHTITLQHKGAKPFEIEAEFLISATGPLSTPNYPNIPGLDQFEGAAFHCYKWDPSYKLEGKRIGVIGNGSSGVQMVPGLGKISGTDVTHFVRSGGYFREKVDYEYSPLAQFGFKWVPGLRLLHRLHIFYQWYNKPLTNAPESVELREKLEANYNVYLRAKAPREYWAALTPSYQLGCKRLAMDAGWLAALHKPNVTLTNSPITSANKTGLVTADGVHHPLDLIVFATGASVATTGVGLSHGVFDKHGRELRARWAEDQGPYGAGPEAYQTLAVYDLPNYFIVLGPNGMAGSWGSSSAVQGAAIARIIGDVIENGGSAVEVREEAATRFNKARQAFLQTMAQASDTCTSWYKLGKGGKVTTTSGYTPIEFWWLVRRTRWADWAVRRKRADGRDEEVDVGLRILLKQAVRGAVWLAGAVVAVNLLVHNKEGGGFARELERLKAVVGL